MKVLLLVALGLMLSMGVSAPAEAQSVSVSVEINFGFFYERLSPHGTWVEIEDHGWCWHPHDVEVGWRPYTHGNWIYADDCGWYFDSDDEWGWAGNHYGRWTAVGARWYWVPGYEWSGAWVAWRNGGGHCGWAPLPPSAYWEAGVGIRMTGFSYETDIHHDSWVFVSHGNFTSHTLHTVVLGSSYNAARIADASITGSVSLSDGLVVNRSVSLDVAVKFTGTSIKTHKVKASGTLGESSLARDDNEVRVFRPTVTKGNATPPRDNEDERIKDAARKTLKERHEAEDRELPERQEKAGKSESARQAEREELDKRHKQENTEVERRPTKRPSQEPGKEPREPGKEPGKEPSQEPGEPGKEPREPGKEPGHEPREPGKEPGKEPKEPKGPKEPRK